MQRMVQIGMVWKQLKSMNLTADDVLVLWTPDFIQALFKALSDSTLRNSALDLLADLVKTNQAREYLLNNADLMNAVLDVESNNNKPITLQLALQVLCNMQQQQQQQQHDENRCLVLLFPIVLPLLESGIRAGGIAKHTALHILLSMAIQQSQCAHVIRGNATLIELLHEVKHGNEYYPRLLSSETLVNLAGVDLTLSKWREAGHDLFEHCLVALEQSIKQPTSARPLQTLRYLLMERANFVHISWPLHEQLCMALEYATEHSFNQSVQWILLCLLEITKDKSHEQYKPVLNIRCRLLNLLPALTSTSSNELKELHWRIDFKYQNMVDLVSASQVTRIGHHASVTRLPVEIFRLVWGMLST